MRYKEDHVSIRTLDYVFFTRFKRGHFKFTVDIDSLGPVVIIVNEDVRLRLHESLRNYVRNHTEIMSSTN